MPIEGILAGVSGLLGGYVQGQRLKQEFEKERQELAFKKKELEVREGLLKRQVDSDTAKAQREAQEVIFGPSGEMVRKLGGDEVRPGPEFNLRASMLRAGVPSDQLQPEPITLGVDTPPVPAGPVVVPPGVQVSTSSQPGRFPTVKYDPIAAAQEQRRITAERKLTALAKTIGPGVDWETIQSQAQEHLDTPLGKALFDRATTELGKFQPTKPSEERESTADKLFGKSWRQLSQEQKVAVDAAILKDKVQLAKEQAGARTKETLEQQGRLIEIIGEIARTKAGEGKRGRFEASLDEPITPAEAILYRLPAGTMRRDLLTQNPQPVTEADIDAGTQFQAARAMLEEYRDVSSRLLTATTAAGSLGQRVRLTFGAYVRTDADAVRLRALQATVPLLVRALGEKGTLATKDVERALDAVPDFADTQQSAQAKIVQLEKFIATVEQQIKSLRPGLERGSSRSGAQSSRPNQGIVVPTPSGPATVRPR